MKESLRHLRKLLVVTRSSLIEGVNTPSALRGYIRSSFSKKFHTFGVLLIGHHLYTIYN